MNPSQRRSARLIELMPIIKAHAEGNIIEYRSTLKGEGWKECYNNKPVWSDTDEYRVKPEPRTFYLAVPKPTADHVLYRNTHVINRAVYEAAANENYEYIKVVEEVAK